MPRKKSPRPNKQNRHPKKDRRGGKPPAHGHFALPKVGVLKITGITDDGEAIAEPVKWNERKKPPHIIITSGKAAKKDDRVLARLTRIKPHVYEAEVMRILPSEQPREILGVYVATADGGLIEPLSRKQKESFFVAHKDRGGAEHGEMVRAISSGGSDSFKMQSAKVQERLGTLNSPRAASLIATHMHELPTLFSEAALAEAEAAPPPTLTLPLKGGGNKREDLRAIPLVTIDGEDARDFDDAVFAEETKDGFHLLVAIADVAHYVEEGGALDGEAYDRGNSVYFPDRVIPMLPERLSNGLCSLKPDEDRYCLAVHIWIDKHGNRQRYQFVRGIMRSHARLTYEEVEALSQLPTGGSNLATIVANLTAAYKALCVERDRRGPLALNLPEYKIRFDAKGNVEAIIPREQLESHRLIEAFMIAANVAAAEHLIKHKMPGIYRVHEHPDEEKLEELRQFVKLSGYSLQKGVITASHLNRVLKASEHKPEQFMVHGAVLRAQMQAYYSSENLGHFGLSLQKYCHFTSPIRRYSDLVVHRSLIEIVNSGLCLVPSKKENTRHKTQGTKHLSAIAEHISETERRAMMAERDASDRYKVSYMQRHIGDSFAGIIAGLNEYGLYVAINDTGVTGFVPVRNLPGDFYMYDKKHGQFKGRRTKQVYHIGQTVSIEVQEANTMTGSLIFGLAGDGPVKEEPHRHPDHKQRGTSFRHKSQKHRR